jgi:hypothetical protein
MLHRAESSSVWLLFQTYGDFLVPSISHNYVNITLPKSHHFVVIFSEGSFFFNLSQPFCSLSLDFHELAIPRVTSSSDSKSMKFCI